MGYYQQQAFVDSRGVGAGVQVRRQSAFGAAKDTFHMPTSPVFLCREVALQFAPVSTARFSLRSPAMVDRNDRFGNLPVFPATTMMFFGVVSRVAEQTTDADVSNCSFHGGQEARRIVAGATTDNRRQDKVTPMVDRNSELEVATEPARPTRTGAAINKVAAGIVSLQARGIHADFACGREQIELPRSADDFS
jgi:hypothetical protein